MNCCFLRVNDMDILRVATPDSQSWHDLHSSGVVDVMKGSGRRDSRLFHVANSAIPLYLFDLSTHRPPV